jgi:hypothetical protein
MPAWLIILLIGVVLVIVGFPVGSLLIWIGIVVLIVALVFGLVGRRGRV